MKRFPNILLISAIILGCVGMFGCGDKADPMYWVDKVNDRPERENALKMISAMLSKLKQDNKDNVQAPAVREFTDKVIPPLSEIFMKIDRDPSNRQEIVKLFAQMDNPKANDVFLKGLELDDISDTQIFVISASELCKQGMVDVVPKLLVVHHKLITARKDRGDTPFTTQENEIERAVLGGIVQLIDANAAVPDKARMVQILADVADERDTVQDLQLNMRAIKGLGRIGDPKAIPVLIRGIAAQGEIQKIGLGPFAVVSLQEILDRDAVVEAIINFGRGKDAEFNHYFEEELKTDPMLSVPVWPIQQSVEFLGNLNYSSPKVIEYLTTELNHREPDHIDELAAEKGQGEQKFDAPTWTMWRRNWAAVSLAQLGYKPVMDFIKEAIEFEKGGQLKTSVEETTGLVRAMGYLQDARNSCPILGALVKSGVSAARDKIYYYTGLMCGKEALSIMEDNYKKTDCVKLIAGFPPEASDEEKSKAKNDCETLKSRNKDYIGWINFTTGCGSDLNCFLKTIADRTSPNLEPAIYAAFRLAKGDDAKSAQVVEALMKNLDIPLPQIMEANIFALDRLTPNGNKALVKRAEEVYRGFSVQAAYKDRARQLEAFVGHVKARTK
jgi:hypothetical protein